MLDRVKFALKFNPSGASHFRAHFTQIAQLLESSSKVPQTTDLFSRLLDRYGELIELKELAPLLKYPSPTALRRAVDGNHLDLKLVTIGRRRVAATQDVAKLLIESGLFQP